MNQKQHPLQLTGVSQTLLLPLLGRALLSQRPNPPIYDQKAIELVNALNVDFEFIQNNIGKKTPLRWIARAYHFDNAIKNYLKKFPDATIVNLGAGLDTTFYRVDNGRLSWIDLDVPEVILLREKILPPPDRVFYLSQSVMDFSWMQKVKELEKPTFFFAGGLLMYLPPLQVKSLLVEMAGNFPQSHFIFDVISSTQMIASNKMLHNIHMNNAIIQWPVDTGKSLETFSPHILCRAHFPYFKNLKTKSCFSLSEKFYMLFYNLSKGGIVELEFLP